MVLPGVTGGRGGGRTLPWLPGSSSQMLAEVDVAVDK